MNGATTVKIARKHVRKRHLRESSFQHELALLRAVGKASGMAPEVLRHGKDDHPEMPWFIDLERLAPLPKWLRSHRQNQALMALTKERLVEGIRTYHAYGIAHRDMHVHNIVMADDHPKLIDWEFGVSDADPNGRPYDLYGPEESGLAVPTAHTNSRPNGIWWGASNAWACHRPFGPLEEQGDNDD